MDFDSSLKGTIAFPNYGVKEISQTVRYVRKAHGLTQTELAGLSGTGLRFVSELERGKPTVSINKVLAVLSVLGVSVLLKNNSK